MAKKYKTFGKRFCTYCGKEEMYYIDLNGTPVGICKCGNTDWWSSRKTPEDVKARYKDRLKPADVPYLFLD